MQKLGDQAADAKDDAELSYELATIKTDCDWAGEGDLDSNLPDQEALIGLFRELEFKTWLDALLQGTDGAASSGLR